MHTLGGSCTMALLIMLSTEQRQRFILQSWIHLNGACIGWLYDHGTRVFCQHTLYLPERHAMLMQEQKASGTGEPKQLGCPPHLLSEIATPGAVAKPAANHCSLQPGIEKRCKSRSGCGSSAGYRRLCRGNLWEQGCRDSNWSKTCWFNLPLCVSHCPQLLLLLLSSRNTFARLELCLN